MNYRTSRLKQDHLGRFYMLQQNMTTMKIKEIIVPVIENCEPFDLRASFGHLRMKAQAVEQEEARLDALVLNRRRIAWVAAWLEAHRERRPFRFIIWRH